LTIITKYSKHVSNISNISNKHKDKLTRRECYVSDMKLIMSDL